MTTGADVVLRPLRPEDGAIVATLFGANGACGGCWCMHWRVPHGGRHWQAVKGAPNRARFLALVAAGRVRAVLAFAGDVPVGWCCIGPVEDFPRAASPGARARGVGGTCGVCDAWGVGSAGGAGGAKGHRDIGGARATRCATCRACGTGCAGACACAIRGRCAMGGFRGIACAASAWHCERGIERILWA